MFSFLAPSSEELWVRRQKPLQWLCLFDRAELKVQEWRSRIIDEKFLPFSRREHRYQPLLHTHSSYAR